MGTETICQKFLAVMWQAAWLIPYEEQLDWMIPTAMLVLLVPFFFVSWGIEYFIIKKLNKQINDYVKLKANIVTYCLFALYPISMFFLN